MRMNGTDSLVEDVTGSPDEWAHGTSVSEPKLLVVGVHHSHLAIPMTPSVRVGGTVMCS